MPQAQGPQFASAPQEAIAAQLGKLRATANDLKLRASDLAQRKSQLSEQRARLGADKRPAALDKRPTSRARHDHSALTADRARWCGRARLADSTSVLEVTTNAAAS